MIHQQLAAHRLYCQQTQPTSFKRASELVSWFGAIQAQEYAQAKWSIGMRLPHLTDEIVERDFNDGKILRTHLLRPTWHFVSAQDIRWMLQLTAPRVHQANAFMYRQSKLDESTFKASQRLIIKLLKGGNHLTREEINSKFEAAGIIASGFRLGYIMMHAELEGIICSGPRRGNQFTYALLEERVPAVKKLSRKEALMELTKRYFQSRGPATIRDFATWSGLMVNDCKEGIALIGGKLSNERVGKEMYYFYPNELNDFSLSDDIHLLSMYDEIIMGYKNRDAFFEYRNSLKPLPLIQFTNMILQSGQVIGTWRRDVQPKKLEIEFAFFKTPTARQIKLAKQSMKRMEQFVGQKVIDS